MTRLFLRFYLGVIAILLAAWLIQATVFRKSAVEENIPVIEDVYASSARLARDQIVRGGEDEFPSTMAYLESRFDYPIRVASRNDRELSKAELDRLDAGDAVLTNYGLLEIAIPDSPWMVELGPLPEFDAPSDTELTLAYGAVFVLTAIGIAILLRPVILQLRSVETAALSIASGDLDARVDGRTARNSVPLAHAFNSMADRVQNLLGTQEEMLQLVSHELRTPLTRIRFATELLKTSSDADRRSDRIEAIDDATDQLDELVGELLVYVKLEAEGQSIRWEEVEVAPLVDHLVAIHDSMHPGLRIHTDVTRAPDSFMGDKQGVARALGNLIGNAAKYARSRIDLTTEEDSNRIRFVVDDDGPGIPPDERAAVFEPFVRLAGEEEGTATSGTGLGLSLVKRITSIQGGSIEVEDSPLGGARFILTFPLKCETESEG